MTAQEKILYYQTLAVTPSVAHAPKERSGEVRRYPSSVNHLLDFRRTHIN
jgi:hypothetical protein